MVLESINERDGHEIELPMTDAEIRPEVLVRSLTEVPAICWSERNANFVIAKVDEQKFRSQFCYRGYQQFGSGHQVIDDRQLCRYHFIRYGRITRKKK